VFASVRRYHFLALDLFDMFDVHAYFCHPRHPFIAILLAMLADVSRLYVFSYKIVTRITRRYPPMCVFVNRVNHHQSFSFFC